MTECSCRKHAWDPHCPVHGKPHESQLAKLLAQFLARRKNG